jgi:hypothetical protein
MSVACRSGKQSAGCMAVLEARAVLAAIRTETIGIAVSKEHDTKIQPIRQLILESKELARMLRANWQR